MRIVFTGSGKFGVASLERLLDGGHQVVAVYTQPDRPAGRGLHLTPTPIAEFAQSRGLAVHKVENLGPDIPQADLMVVIAFGRKIPPEPLSLPRWGSVNLHASRLPRFRGAAPINWAIIRGENNSGNSVIRLAQKMDAGAILSQSSVPIGATQTAGELHDVLAMDGAPLLLQTLAEIESGKAVETPQDPSQVSLAPKLGRADSLLNWQRPASELACRIRGLSPWPGCRVRLLDADREIVTLTLLRAVAAEPESGGGAPGSINQAGDIVAGDGRVVRVMDVQPSGKNQMTLQAFARGHAWKAGMQVESISAAH